MNLLDDLITLEPCDPDVDKSFINAIIEYYLSPSDDVVQKTFEIIENNPTANGIDIAVSLVIRMVHIRLENEYDGQNERCKWVKRTIEVYRKAEERSKNMNTKKECFYNMMTTMVQKAYVQNEEEEVLLLDECFSQLTDSHLNLFSLLEIQNLAKELMLLLPRDIWLPKIVHSLEHSLAWFQELEGVSKILASVLASSTDDDRSHFKLPEEILGRLITVEGFSLGGSACQVVAYHLLNHTELWNSSDKLKALNSQIKDNRTRLVIFSVLLRLASTVYPDRILHDTRKLLFSFLLKVSDNDIDYVVEFVELYMPKENLQRQLESWFPHFSNPISYSRKSLTQICDIVHRLNPESSFYENFYQALKPNLTGADCVYDIPAFRQLPGSKKFLHDFAISILNDSPGLDDLDRAIDIMKLLLDDDFDWHDIDNLDDKLVACVAQYDNQFLAENAVYILARVNVVKFLERAVEFYGLRTSGAIRKAIVVGLRRAFDSSEISNTNLKSVVFTIADSIVRFDDDGPVKEEMLELIVNHLPDEEKAMELVGILSPEVETYRRRQHSNARFAGDSKAQLDHLLATLKRQASTPGFCFVDCVAKECY